MFTCAGAATQSPVRVEAGRRLTWGWGGRRQPTYKRARGVHAFSHRTAWEAPWGLVRVYPRPALLHRPIWLGNFQIGLRGECSSLLGTFCAVLFQDCLTHTPR